MRIYWIQIPEKGLSVALILLQTEFKDGSTLEADQRLGRKNNTSTTNHITTIKRILTVVPATGLTCFCHAHYESLPISLLHSVNGDCLVLWFEQVKGG